MARKIESMNVVANKSGLHIVKFDDGTVAVVPATKLDDICTAYEAAHLQATRMDTAALITLAAAFEDDAPVSAMLEDMAKIDPPQTIVIKDTAPRSAMSIDPLAQRLGQMLAENTEAVRDIQSFVDIRLELKRLPASIPYYLQSVFDKDIRAQMPVAGTVMPEGYTGNGRFEYKDEKVGTESWFAGMAYMFPGYWENIGDHISEIQVALDPNNSAKNRYTGKDINVNKAFLKQYQKKKSDLIAAIRDAIGLLNFRDEVQEKTGIKTFFRTVVDKESLVTSIEQTNAPLRIFYVDPTKTEEMPGYMRENVLSVGAYMRVNLDKVLAADDPFEAFKPDRATNEKAQALSGISNSTELERVLGWLAVNVENTELKTSFIRRLSGPPSESDPLLELAAEAHDFLDRILSNKMRQRALVLRQAKLDAKLGATIAPQDAPSKATLVTA